VFQRDARDARRKERYALKILPKQVRDIALSLMFICCYRVLIYAYLRLMLSRLASYAEEAEADKRLRRKLNASDGATRDAQNAAEKKRKATKDIPGEKIEAGVMMSTV